MGNKENEMLKIIQEALNVGDGKITFDSSVKNVEEWDSLGHLSILVALDKRFGGKVANIREMSSADSVNKIIQLLKDNSLV